MNKEIEAKYQLLKEHLKGLESVVIGLSGGVDSSLLVKVSHDILGKKAIAVTLVSPMTPAWDIEDAKLVTAQVGMEHILIEEKAIDTSVSNNPANRCYFCKQKEFGSIIKIAKEKGFGFVLDGSNVDDKSDYRPGAKALEELKVVSPLKTVGFTKAEIRQLSKYLGLPTWNKPAYACLASRIPYGNEITLKKLSKIEKSEAFLHGLGYLEVRVRDHGDIARIELSPDDRIRFCQPETMDLVSQRLKEYGFIYVCLELEGYVMGSLNKKISVKNEQ